MSSLSVSEIFASIQGESTQLGRPCVFIRLAGCNLDCVYCDTVYAAKSKGEPMDIDDIVAKAESYGIKLVEITGGEPLIQPGCAELVKLLHERGFEVMIETNGTIDIGPVNEMARCVVDIKTPGSGCGGSFNEINFARLKVTDEIKFVITSRDDFDWAVDICTKRGLCEKAPVLFSAAWGNVTMEDVARWLMESRLNARLNPQLHKIIWGKDARGV